MIRLRAFRAIEDKQLCERYVEGHVKVLLDYGIQNVTSNSNTWVFNPSMYGVVAESEKGEELYGGIRVQVVDGIHPLPVEEAVGKMDAQIYERVKSYAQIGTGELCGLWNAKKLAGKGISILLVRAGISIINQINMKTMVGICADYTLPMFTRVGFVIDRTLGNNGEFIYPNEEYRAKVLGILNGETLETAHSYDKERMLGLRENPRQRFTETGPKGELDIQYDLIIL